MTPTKVEKMRTRLDRDSTHVVVLREMTKGSKLSRMAADVARQYQSLSRALEGLELELIDRERGRA